MRPHQIPTLPWDVISLDLITGLPPSQGYDAILVVVDKLSKYALYIPTTSALSQSGFASLFLEHVVQRFGLPLEMIADRDARWAKSFWAAVAGHLKLNVLLSTSHHPQHDGQTERQNQTLEIALRAYVAGSKTSWAKWLPALAFAYNSTPSLATGYSPSFLLYSFEPRSPANHILRDSRSIMRPPFSQPAREFVQELEVHHALARDALARSLAGQARAYDQKRRPEEYEVGDEVLMNPHSLGLVDVKGSGRKLLQRRMGPFTITEKISPVVYRLRLPKEFQMHPLINIEHLTKYQRSEEDNSRAQLGDLRILSGETEYEVDKIVGHRFNRSLNRVEYLVRWKGFGPEHDTFESEAHLCNAFSQVRSYRSRLQNAHSSLGTPSE